MQAVKWAVAKLQGDKTASFCRKISGRESYRVTNQHPSLPWNFMTHAFLHPSASPEDFRSHGRRAPGFFGAQGSSLPCGPRLTTYRTQAWTCSAAAQGEAAK